MFKLMRAQIESQAEDRDRESRVRQRVIVLSVLLHLLFLAIWDSAVRLDLATLVPAIPAPPPQAAPLVFDLQPPDLPREVIATPDDARTTKTPQKADFLSDKNAVARNQEPAPLLPQTGEPFSRGDLVSHDLPPSPSLPEQPQRPEPARAEAQAGDERESDSPDPEAEADADRAVSRQQKPDAAPRRPFRLDLPGVPHQQLEGRAAEEGGLSFNTYDWDFAPYMLALKQRIGHNIFPPLAYTMLGMIDGDTMLRFKIYPNGRLADLELLGYRGHRTLMETSRSAITISAPFPALPADFPKPYLEVTARFSYFVKR